MDARRFGEYMRSCVTEDLARRMYEAMGTDDVADLLPEVNVPTLVLHTGVKHVSLDIVQRVAASIANARLVVIDSDAEQVSEAMSEFLGVTLSDTASAASSGSDEPKPSGTAIILFADVVDSTALAEQLGNATFRERSRLLEKRVREQITVHAGRPIAGRTLGDGVLATFASASDAIAAAMDCATAGAEVGLALHLGLHAGDVMRENANVYGQAVSIASRISGLSAPNEVLVSATVRDLARASAGVVFEDRGERELKGVSEPVRVFAVVGGG